MTIPADIISQVNNLMRSGFEIPEAKLQPQSMLNADLGLDSLDAVDMLVYIEETLGVKVEGERLAQLKTLNDVYVLVAESAVRGQQLNAQSR
jgi:acyl carrier protein